MDVASHAFKDADSYDNARKGYPLESAQLFLSKLQDRSTPGTILELAAGTGQFTKVLIEAAKESGFKVLVSEPLESMGEVFRKNFPSLELMCCSGNKIPLPDSSVDAVVAANAMHYLTNIECYTEIARVLKPDGILAFVYTDIDVKRAPWAQPMTDLSVKFYGRVGINLPIDQNGVINEWEKVALDTALYEKMRKDFSLYVDPITEEGAVNYVMSFGSFQHCRDEAEREEVRKNFEKILHDNFSGVGKTMSEIPMKCDLFWMQKVLETKA